MVPQEPPSPTDDAPAIHVEMRRGSASRSTAKAPTDLSPGSSSGQALVLRNPSHQFSSCFPSRLVELAPQHGDASFGIDSCRRNVLMPEDVLHVGNVHADGQTRIAGVQLRGYGRRELRARGQVL